MIRNIITFVLLASVGVNVVLFVLIGLLSPKIFFSKNRPVNRIASMLTAIAIVTVIQIILIGILLLIGET